MSGNHDSKQLRTNANPDIALKPSHTPIPVITHAHKTYTHQVSSIQDKNPNITPETFIKQGKVFAHTVNAPFTTIPFIPAATAILKRFDKTTKQDLGVTYKASISKQSNAQGEHDLLYKVDYIGLGVMSSKFNVQVAPIAAKIEVGKEVYKGMGCNASVLSSPVGSIHERAGVKLTFTDCNKDSSKSVSAAAEASYQKSSSFKPLSTITYGYFFGNDATIRIPAKYVPLYNRAMADLPSWEESKVALDHIAPVFPFMMQGEALAKGVELAGKLTEPVQSAAKSMLKTAAELDINGINAITHQHRKLSSPTIIKSTAANNAPIATANQHNKPHVPAYTIPVKHGENLWKIAARETGDPYQYKVIADKNHIRNPDVIFPSNEKKLTIPGYQKSNEEKTTYMISSGDTLDSIGKKTGHLWQEILDLNKAMLKNNPDRIYPGQELLIPENQHTAHDHAALINNPVVQARIKENMARQLAQQNIAL